MKGFRVAAGVMAALLISGVEANVRFLHNSALVELSNQEMQSLRAFCRDALVQAEDTEKRVWRSDASDAAAVFKPVASFNLGQRECRRGVVAIRKAHKQDLLRMDFCQYDGQWKHTPTPIIYLSDDDKQAFMDEVHFLLDSEITKHPISWQNTSKSVFGSMVVVAEDSQTQCKEVAASLSSTSGAEINGVYRFCLQQGEWHYIQPER